MNAPLIRYQNVSISQQGLEILEDVNFELNKGEFVYLIGKVGSGKTSFLKTVYGELEIQSGEAEVMGYDLCANWRMRGLKSCTLRGHQAAKKNQRGNGSDPLLLLNSPQPRPYT